MYADVHFSLNTAMHHFADIAIPGGPDMLLTYGIPEKLLGKIEPGMRVIIPFRRTHTVGVVVKMRDGSPVEKIRDIVDCPDEKPVFEPKMIELLLWLSDYYSACPGDAFRCALPGGMGTDVDRIIRRVSGETTGDLHKKSREILELLEQRGDIPERRLKKLVGDGFFPALDELIARDLVRIDIEIKRTRVPKTATFISLKLDARELAEEIESLGEKAQRQRELLEFLRDNPEEKFAKGSLSAQFGASTIKKAIDFGWVIEQKQEVLRRTEIKMRLSDPPKAEDLTRSQKNAIETIGKSIKKECFKPYLLWGVTGSGKTEIYLNAARIALDAGKGVLILVPEISLTPQVWGRFEQRFSGETAVLHSALKPGERFDAWRALHEGRFRVAIGTRSAVFAPVKDLGLIVVDEEHDPSFKQEEPPPYYNGRDVAVMRAKMENCPIVLGSATPSAESYFNAKEGKYELLELPERIPGAKLPGVRVVDMVAEREDRTNFSPFSRLLASKLAETVANGYRAMILLNRRGFSSHIQCPDCGYIPTCQACGIGFTFHIVDSRLRCHYCGAEETAPDICPICASDKFKFRGSGTQRIESELAEMIGEKRIFRLDADSADDLGHSAVLDRFQKTPGSVLVGTQMIAKGHDFPDVALVGVINADIGLTFPDFRSGERIFQLLTQVSGRAGRSAIRGEVIIQTYRPQFPAIDYAVNGDVKSFFEAELKERERLYYPPFGRLIRILARSEDPKEVRNGIFRLTRELSVVDKTGDKYRLLGPAPCPLAKLRGEYRWHLLVKTKRLKTSMTIAKRLISSYGDKVTYKLVVDPMDLL